MRSIASVLGEGSILIKNIIFNSYHELFFFLIYEARKKKSSKRKKKHVLSILASSVLTELGNKQNPSQTVLVFGNNFNGITNFYASPLTTLPKQRQLNVAFAERVAERSSDEGVIPLTRISKLRCRQEILTSPTRGEVAWYTKSEDSLW